MAIVESELAPLHIPRLAALATSASPAWLWSTDSTRILWANAVAAAIFGAASVTELVQARFNSKNPAAAQILRLSATLPPTGQERLERLRGFGAGFGGTLTCVCSRLVLPNGIGAVLVAAAEPAGPALPLSERVRRLFAGDDRALAAFSPNGTLIHANAAALKRLGPTPAFSTLGIEALAAKAFQSGRAVGAARLSDPHADVIAEPLGKDESRILLLKLPPPPKPAPPPPPAPETAKPAPAAATAPEPRAEAPSPPPLSPPPSPAAAPAAAAASATRQTTTPDGPVSERRHPLRFVWQMDADGRFIVGSDEFMELVGPRTMAACGRLWSEIAAELKLDPENQVTRAVATHETWSGILISWPLDELSERLPVELSGLPIFDRDRSFAGYRGFGVCRDVDRVNQLARARRARTIGFMPAAAPAPAAAAPPANEPPASGHTAAAPIPAPQQQAPPAPVSPEPADQTAPQGEQPGSAAGVATAAEPAPSANVVLFRPATAAPAPQQPDAKPPSLSPIERSAFRELAQELTSRLRGSPDEPATAEPSQTNEPGGEAIAPQESVPPAMPAEAAHAAVGGETATASETIERVAADLPPIASQIAPALSTETGPADAHAAQPLSAERALLDRVPAGVLVYRNETPIYANRHFLELTGYDSIDDLTAAGGLHTLFAEPGAGALADDGSAHTLSVVTRGGDKLPVESRLFTIPWNGASALALTLTSGEANERQRTAQAALGTAENEIRELKSALDRTARREAQKSAAAKADFLAKVSHEIRTPLNSMIGFAEVIMAERFGSIGNERYRDYLKDMHAAGTHLVSLLNDLLDLSKIESGQLELTFADIDLNDVTQQCVGIMQPQANRARIIIRSALTPSLPQVVADARSVRQIALNLLANAIKFTGPGGQVIVSTAVTDAGEVVLRVRDTGVGMREKDIDAVLDPFAQTASASWGSSGNGLGLPLTKALAEANRASFTIKSAPNAGTLVEIAFPGTRSAAPRAW